MNTYLTAHFVIALNALILALLVSFSAWYLDMQGDTLENALTLHIEATRERISYLAELTDRNGADALTERIITDCPRRSEFEALLSRLGTLSPKELLTTQQLFESCGPFYAERKAIMVAQLTREYEALTVDLQYLEALRDLSHDESELSLWAELLKHEEERSAFLFEQTELQSDILTLLINGGSPKEVQDKAAQARNVAESLTVTDARIDSLRASLIP